MPSQPRDRNADYLLIPRPEYRLVNHKKTSTEVLVFIVIDKF